MICPNCGSDAGDAKFCTNCGAALPNLQDAEASVQASADSLADFLRSQPPYSERTADDVPAADSAAPDSLWAQDAAKAQQAASTNAGVGGVGVGAGVGFAGAAGQADQTYQSSPTGGPQSAQPQSNTYQASSPYQQGSPYGQSSPNQTTYAGGTGNAAPSTAFVLVIVGLVLSLLFATALPGLICSIIGLVLNSGYNKKGFNNPRKTSTMVVGIIGVVIALLAIVFTIFIAVMTAGVLSEAERQGIDLASDKVEVVTNSDGSVSIKVDDSSSSSASATASKSSASDKSSESASSSDTSAASASALSASPARDLSSFPATCTDGYGNVTLYALCELTGEDLCALLDAAGYVYDSSYHVWDAPSGGMFAVTSTDGDLSNDDVAKLEPTGAGTGLVYLELAAGYDSPSDAFPGLSGVVTEDVFETEDALYAVVYGPSMKRLLVIVTDQGDNMLSLLAYNDEAIEQGLFEETIGVNAGSTMREVWGSITGGYEIGGYVSR